MAINVIFQKNAYAANLRNLEKIRESLQIKCKSENKKKENQSLHKLSLYCNTAHIWVY